MNNIAEQEMLTKTYTSVALSHEQKNAWKLLADLTTSLQAATRDTAAAALHEFAAAERYYHARAIEQHVIPAIRESVAEASALLTALAALTARANRILHQVREQLQSGAPTVEQEQSAFCALEQYCELVRERLVKEEGELMPLAFRALTPEEWFAIAVNCLPGDEACAKMAA